MRPTKTPQEAIESEFSCYYHGDELGSVQAEGFRALLPRMTWDSARRLRQDVGEDKVAELIRVLESMKAEPYGAMMSVIINATMIGWPDDPRDWAVFENLIDRIIGFLRQGPGPRPQ